MIDESRLIDNLKKEWEELCDYSENVETLLEYLIRFIGGQPKIGGWIPCSERLPDRGVMNPITNDYAEYLCTVCVDGLRTVRPIKFDKDGCWVNHGMNFDKYVTAWQPLPEAYHG